MASVESHRDLIVWQKSMRVVVDSYQITKQFPSDEKFGLVSQIRRAAVSIPSNIAEGKARGFTKAYLNHLSIAAGSIAELDTQFELAEQLNFISTETKNDIQQSLREIGRMLSGLRNSLNNVPKS